jgi:hypothetical protein
VWAFGSFSLHRATDLLGGYHLVADVDREGGALLPLSLASLFNSPSPLQPPAIAVNTADQTVTTVNADLPLTDWQSSHCMSLVRHYIVDFFVRESGVI